MTLKQAFCRRRGLSESEFGPEFLSEALYPQARLLMKVVGAHAPMFETDLALVTYCGDLRTESEIEKELHEYARVAENQKFARRVLKLRVSGRRFARMAERCGLKV